MSEQLQSSICERAYPVYNEVRAKADPAIKELTEALKHEKNPIYRKAPEPSSNSSVAALQDELRMPRVVLEHLAERAAATAGIPGEMSTEDIRKMVSNPVYCLDRVAPWIAEPPGPVIPIEQWVAASAKLIEEIGAESYLRLLIRNLRGESAKYELGRFEPSRQLTKRHCWSRSRKPSGRLGRMATHSRAALPLRRLPMVRLGQGCTSF
jgi:hypothetical protein